jgi:RimJ/RimL family protein N-acetyltransferase
MTHTVRPLAVSDWEDLRAIRLEALQNHRGVFSAPYEKEVLKTPDDWQAQLAMTDRAMFGVFMDGQLAGIVGVNVIHDSPEQQNMAHMGALYVRTGYRGRGLSKHLCRATMEWLATRSELERMDVSHREGNDALRGTLSRLGFRPTITVPVQWQDGVVADDVRYEISREEARQVLALSSPGVSSPRRPPGL